MILIVFVGSNTPLRLLLTRISWPQVPYSKKPPSYYRYMKKYRNFDVLLEWINTLTKRLPFVTR